MVAKKHFQRLKNIYAKQSAETPGEQLAMSYGRAELSGEVTSANAETVVHRMSHHRLLSDVASLAAATLEKEHFVTAENFLMDIENPTYEGPVEAVAEVIMVEPPQTIVEATLMTEDGERIAEATGVFRPSEEPLPSDPTPDQEGEPLSMLPPASFMPVYSTPYGLLCLN